MIDPYLKMLADRGNPAAAEMLRSMGPSGAEIAWWLFRGALRLAAEIAVILIAWRMA